MVFYEGLGGGGFTASSKRTNKFISFITNTSEEKVLEADYYAFYKGTLVVKVDAMDDSSFSIGLIFMGPNVTNPELVKHERGHGYQLAGLGIDDYFINVAVPSITCFWLTQYEIIPYSMYHSLPWEYKANEYACASFPHTSWAKVVSDIYWIFSKVMSML